MESLAKGHQVLEDKVTVTLTQRDLLLLKLFLQMVAEDYTRSSALRFDIQRLRDKLSTEQTQECLSTSTKSGNQGQRRRKSNKT